MRRVTKRLIYMITILTLIVSLFPCSGTTMATAYVTDNADDVINISSNAELILHYNMKNVEGTTVKDVAGNFDGTLKNPESAECITASNGTGGVINFKGGSTSAYIEIPQGVLDNLENVTVSSLVNWSGNNTVEWLFAFGQDSNKYLYFTPKHNSDSSARFGIATNGWRNEAAAKAGTLAANEWKLVTTVFSGQEKTLKLYVDGELVASRSSNDISLRDIKSIEGISGYIGKSFYTGDPYFGGMIADFQVYNDALTASEVENLKEAADKKIVKLDALLLEYAANQLDYDLFLNENKSKDEIITDLSFPDSIFGTSITWESDAPDIITNEGKVHRPSYDKGDQVVIITATLSDGKNIVTREFTVTVKRRPSDSEAVKMDAETLAVHNIHDVRGNLALPTVGENGSTITWKSEDPSIITPTGEVKRPEYGSGDANVKLTATLTLNDETVTKAFLATVKELPDKEDYAGYVFTYFTGEGYANGEQVYLALSQGNDPLNWQELNDGKPIFTSELGERGLRDPFIIRSPEGDKFYLIATDLKIYGNGDWNRAQTTGSRSIMVWESNDLIHWSEQRMVEVAPPEAGNTWAPEAFYDEEAGEYVIFWASKLYDDESDRNSGASYQRIMYTTTRDFYTFSEPKVYMDYGYSIIDTTMIEHDGKIYRFTKDERNNSSSSPNGKFVFQEVGHSIFDSNFELIKEGIGKGAISRGEGPTVFKSNTEDKWYLFIDEFGGRGYVPFETTDLDSGEWTMSENYNLPSRPRHGTVLPVTESEYERLLSNVPRVEEPGEETSVTGVTLDRETVTLAVGEETQLTATVTPPNAGNQEVLWSSSNEEVAVVDDYGNVTAIKEGFARISATTVDGGYIAISEVRVGVDSASIKALVEQLAEEGEFANSGAARSLAVHLTAVEQFENKGAAGKVVKHMQSFKLLLDHQKEKGFISDRAYDILVSNTDSLIKQWLTKKNI